MTIEQLQREMNYRTALSFIRQWAEEGLIDPREYVKINTILAEKFSPVWGHISPETR